MRRNLLVLGERYIEGDYGCIMAAGELHVDNSDIRSLYLAGETSIHRSAVHKLFGAGEVNANTLSFGNVKVVGEVNLQGFCKGDTLTITGDLSAEFLECRILGSSLPGLKGKKGRFVWGNGHFTWQGKLKAVTFENLYALDLSGCDYEFNNIISSGFLSYNGEIACNNFYSFGGLCCEGINAENITVIINDYISLQSVAGSNIRISKAFQADRLFKSIPKSFKYKNFTSDCGIVYIPSIEGDAINIEYTRSDVVSGVDVVIGDLCIIDRVEYSGSVVISGKAVVNEVVRL
ncbi:MAG: hypothetical protein C0P72_002305 [Clostridia bacterium]